MPLKFSLEEQPKTEEQPKSVAYDAAPDLAAMQASVATLNLLGEEYQSLKERLTNGAAYLRGQAGGVYTPWVEQLLSLEYGDERAAGIAERIAKVRPKAKAALRLYVGLAAKAAGVLRRVDDEAARQHELEGRITGGRGYVCVWCWRVAGQASTHREVT